MTKIKPYPSKPLFTLRLTLMRLSL